MHILNMKENSTHSVCLSVTAPAGATRTLWAQLRYQKKALITRIKINVGIELKLDTKKPLLANGTISPKSKICCTHFSNRNCRNFDASAVQTFCVYLRDGPSFNVLICV